MSFVGHTNRKDDEQRMVVTGRIIVVSETHVPSKPKEMDIKKKENCDRIPKNSGETGVLEAPDCRFLQQIWHLEREKDRENDVF